MAAKDGSPIDVLRSTGDALTAMGVSLMRNGGSVSQSMRLKDFRGPRWNRCGRSLLLHRERALGPALAASAAVAAAAAFY